MVLYLGKVLPPAMMGLLVVYCFKNVSWLSGTHGAPELLASAAVVGLHLVEAERAVLHRRRHGAVHGSGAGRFRIK